MVNNNNNNKKNTRLIVDFALPADNWVELKGNWKEG